MTRDNLLYATIGILAGFISGYFTHEVMALRQPPPLAVLQAGRRRKETTNAGAEPRPCPPEGPRATAASWRRGGGRTRHGDILARERRKNPKTPTHLTLDNLNTTSATGPPRSTSATEAAAAAA